MMVGLPSMSELERDFRESELKNANIRNLTRNADFPQLSYHKKGEIVKELFITYNKMSSLYFQMNMHTLCNTTEDIGSEDNIGKLINECEIAEKLQQNPLNKENIQNAINFYLGPIQLCNTIVIDYMNKTDVAFDLYKDIKVEEMINAIKNNSNLPQKEDNKESLEEELAENESPLKELAQNANINSQSVKEAKELVLKNIIYLSRTYENYYHLNLLKVDEVITDLMNDESFIDRLKGMDKFHGIKNADDAKKYLSFYFMPLNMNYRTEQLKNYKKTLNELSEILMKVTASEAVQKLMQLDLTNYVD